MKRIYVLLIIITVILISAVAVFNYINEDGEKSPQQINTREVLLYFSTQDALYLEAESRTVTEEDIYKNTMEELIKGPESSSLNKTIPEGVEIIDINISDGIAEINFNIKLKENHWGGSTGERMTVYSIVNTLTQFDNIDRVLILLEGEEIDTLAGHMDLSRPLSRNEEIIKK